MFVYKWSNANLEVTKHENMCLAYLTILLDVSPSIFFRTLVPEKFTPSKI